MRAVVIRDHGGPDVLSYEEFDDPHPINDHVLIRVDYCAVNHLDLWVRKGLPGMQVRFPHILGSDICGTLLEGFGTHKKGEKVIVYPAVESTNPRISYSIIGGFSEYLGGYAEFIQVPKKNVIRKPPWFTDREACALNVSYLTAWNMLEESRCKKGDTVLIWGASGGVGSAAILLAKARGLKVITVTSSKKKMDFAKKMGADFIIDRIKSDVVSEVLRQTHEFGVDAVIDHVGANTWQNSLEVLKVKGRMVACGTTSGGDVTMNIRSLYSKGATISGAYLGKKSQINSLHRFMKLKKLRPVIDSVFDLKEAQKAHRRMEKGLHFGKIVLKVSS